MLDVPHLRQLRSWSCGPACVRMVLAFYGETISEAELIEELESTETDGTRPELLLRYLRRRGYVARTASGGLPALQLSDRRLRPSIVAFQAWGPPRTEYATSYDQGHYAVVVGADDRRITLCDPSSKRPRRHFATDEFLARWRDIGSGPNPKIYRQWGLSVGPKR